FYTLLRRWSELRKARRRRLLAEARRVIVLGRAGLQLGIAWVQLQRALDQHGLVLTMLRVGQAALYRADRLTGFVIVETHALRAELRVDDVDLVPFADRLVRALRLASAAVDAVRGDVGAHVISGESSSRR